MYGQVAGVIKLTDVLTLPSWPPDDQGAESCLL